MTTHVYDRRRQCTSKMPYESRAHAIKQLKLMQRRGIRNDHTTSHLAPYSCPWCGRWHLGTKKKIKRKRDQQKERDK